MRGLKISDEINMLEKGFYMYLLCGYVVVLCLNAV